MNRLSVCCAAWSLIASASFAVADDVELKRFQGHWQVIELVEDGKVIPPSAIEDWLPSGGKIEIVDNAIVTTSTDDGKKQVRILDVDATQYPKGIEIKSRDKSE
ncbi:MAG: TIGR03067 domain-containing protein, partial [Planctomycetia bacterium]|nr:TIGR03067 domain-containing protein [Planctomycetia bacterium]